MTQLFLIFIAIIIILSSCNDLTDKEKLSYQMINMHAEKQKKNNHLNLIGSGGAIPDKINVLMLSYVGYQKLQLDEARKLMVKSIEDLIQKVNATPEIHPYLRDYPFTEKNADITITFRDVRDKFVDPPYIAFITITNDGYIIYSKNNLSPGLISFTFSLYVIT